MSRKLVCTLLLTFTQLSALPGCLHLPYFSSSTSEAPKKIYDNGDGHSAEVISHKRFPDEPVGLSTAQAREEPAPKVMRPEKNALPLLDLPRPEPVRPKQTTGIVSIEAIELKASPVQVQDAEKLKDLPAVRAFRCILEKRHDEAIQHLKAYDQETQEFFLRLFPVFAMVVQRPIGELTAAEVAIVNEQLVNALLMFRARSELTVSKMCLCRQVKAFAAYEPLPDNHEFVAGTPNRLGEEVQLYVELSNFNSEKTKDGLYLMKLAWTLELHDAAGKKIWSREVDRTETARRTRPNDFYRNYTFFVPALPPGRYQLVMNVMDETNPDQRRGAARGALAFRVTPAGN